MGKVIGLVSLKGGVGKTTLSCALATDLSHRLGKKVLLVDANYSAPNLGIHMNIISPKKTIHDVLSGGSKISHAVHETHGVDVVPGDFLFKRNYSPLKLKNKLVAVKKKYDFIILDASPSLNEEVMSTVLASDNLFIVSTPDYPTLSCSMKIARLVEKRNKSVAGIILNKVKGKYDVSIEEVQQSTGIPVVAKVREDSVVPMALSERIPATLFAKNTGFAREIASLSNALIGEKARVSVWDRMFGKDFAKEHVNREVMRKSFYRSMFE